MCLDAIYSILTTNKEVKIDFHLYKYKNKQKGYDPWKHRTVKKINLISIYNNK